MFSDYEAKAVSFYKKKKNIDEEVKLVQTEDFEIEMEEKIIQTPIRKERPIQTDISEMASIASSTIKYNPENLKKFFDKVYPILKDALETVGEGFTSIIILMQDYDSDEEEERNMTDELVVRIPTITDKSTRMSDSNWNSRGDCLYVSSHVDAHIGPCNHSSLFYYFKFKEFLKVIDPNTIDKNYVEFGACIKCIEPHPRNPDLIAIATYIGEISIIDMQRPEIIQFSSLTDYYFHKECVVSLKWIKFENDHLLLSLSEEGKLLIWDMNDNLKCPAQGYLLKFKMKDVKLPLQINPMVISQNPFENFHFLIGTIEGNIYRCILTISSNLKNENAFANNTGFVWKNSVKRLLDNCTEDIVLDIKKETEKYLKNKDTVEIGPEEFFKSKPDMTKFYKNALKSNFEKHISVVRTISFHHFVKSIFVTTAYDGSMRIYHYNQSKYLLSNYIDGDFFTTATFSPHNPNLILVGTSTGRILFYKIKDRSFKLLHKIERKQHGSAMVFPVVSLKFNPNYKEIISASFEDGLSELIRLSESFYIYKYEDISKFSKLITGMMA